MIFAIQEDYGHNTYHDGLNHIENYVYVFIFDINVDSGYAYMDYTNGCSHNFASIDKCWPSDPHRGSGVVGEGDQTSWRGMINLVLLSSTPIVAWDEVWGLLILGVAWCRECWTMDMVTHAALMIEHIKGSLDLNSSRNYQ